MDSESWLPEPTCENQINHAPCFEVTLNDEPPIVAGLAN